MTLAQIWEGCTLLEKIFFAGGALMLACVIVLIFFLPSMSSVWSTFEDLPESSEDTPRKERVKMNPNWNFVFLLIFIAFVIWLFLNK